MTPTASRRLTAVLALSIVFLTGCGDSDPSATAAPAAGAAVAADRGVAVSKASELAGAWYRDGAADGTVGLEFAPDGKLTVLIADGRPAPSQQTVDYALLEDGRLRLTLPGNASMTQVLQCNRNGSTLTIALETSGFADGMVEGSYTKLAGQTIAARYAQVRQENEQRLAALVEKVREFLNQPDLVMVPTDASPAVPVALNVKGGPDVWTGSAILAGNNMAYEREARIGLDPFEPNSNKPLTLRCQLGGLIGPPGLRPVQPEQIVFTVESKGDTLDIRDGTARTLRIDKNTSDKLSGAYAEAVRKQRERIAAAHAKLGALVLAELRQPNNPRPRRIALMRMPDKDLYRFADLRNATGPLLANHFVGDLSLVLQNDETFLASPQMPGQAYRVSSEGSGLKLELIANNLATPLTITRSFTAEQLAAKRAEIASFVAGLKQKPLSLVGQFYQSYTYENGYVRPIRLELSSPDGKSLAGTMHSDAMAQSLPIRGTIGESVLGLILNFEVAKPGAQVVRFEEGGTFTASLDLEDGTPMVVGQVKPGDGSNRLELAPPSPQRTAELQKQLENHLAAGGTFKWARTGNTGGSNEVLTLTLQSDNSGALTGTVGFRRSTAPLTGKVTTEEGIVVLDLTIAETPPKSVATGTMRLWVVPYGDTFYLSGIGRWAPKNEARFICYGPAEK